MGISLAMAIKKKLPVILLFCPIKYTVFAPNGTSRSTKQIRIIPDAEGFVLKNFQSQQKAMIEWQYNKKEKHYKPNYEVSNWQIAKLLLTLHAQRLTSLCHAFTIEKKLHDVP